MKICSVYLSSRKDEMYLYVNKSEQLSRVPEALLERFGNPRHVMDIPLTNARKLARVDTEQVMADIDKKGYFLQMPPAKEDYLLDLYVERPTTGVR